MEADDLVYQTRTHLHYELKWMICAAARYAENRAGDPYVALIDSAAVHARNLFEFAKLRGKGSEDYTLESLGGTPDEDKKWHRWLHNRVLHMHEREKDRPDWPGPRGDDGRYDLMAMAHDVLTHLETRGPTIPAGPPRAAFDTVLGGARTYWTSPSEQAHQTFHKLFDASKETDPYAGKRPAR